MTVPDETRRKCRCARGHPSVEGTSTGLRVMAKRSGLIRMGARAHAPGGGGGEKKKKIKKKTKLKVKTKKIAVAAAAAVADAGPDIAMDDMFAMALPTARAAANTDDLVQQGKNKKKTGRFAMAPADLDMEKPAAFEDESKESMFRRILEGAKTAKHEQRIPADEHRALMERLKMQKLERAARKMERFKAHQKC